MRTSDTVLLRVPLKAEYVSIARLTASGIANHAGFDYDSIEDIKVAISEVIGKVIEKKASDDQMTIAFDFLDDGLAINFKLAENNISDLFQNDTDDLALAIISSLMDEVDMQEKDKTVIAMVKKLGKVV